MGLKEKVLELMKEPKGITVREIANELNTTEKAINSYISRLKKKGKITNENIINKIYLDNTKGKKYYLYKILEKPMDKNSLKYPSSDIQILKNGILELNKLMSIVKPKIPSIIDINKIREGIELCHTI